MAQRARWGSPPLTKLALDLGTITGFAWRPLPDGQIVSGTWSLRPGKYDGAGMRGIKLLAALKATHASFPITHIGFEAVRRHLGTDAAHVYGGLLLVLQTWAETSHIPYEGVPVQAIKKHWTNKGNANKEAMIAEAVRRGFPVSSDDEADAIALLHLMEGEGA